MIVSIIIEFKRMQMGFSNLLFQGLLDNTSNISLNAIEHESIKKSCVQSNMATRQHIWQQ